MTLLRGVSAGKVTQPRVVVGADGQYTIYVTLGHKPPQTLYATSIGASSQVTPRPTTLSLSPATFGFGTQNQTQQLLATVKDQFGNIISPTPALTWATNDARITVNNAGLCTGLQTGANATITATITGSTITGTASLSTPTQIATTFTINAGFSTVAAAAAAGGMKFGLSFQVNNESHPNFSQCYQQTAGSGGFGAFELWHTRWWSAPFASTALSGATLNFLGLAGAEIAKLQQQGTPICLTYAIDEGISAGWGATGSNPGNISALVTTAPQAIQMAQTMVALNMAFFVPKALGTAYSGATTYSVGTLVSLAGANYLCIKAGTVGVSPPNTTNWLPYPVATITAWNSGTAYTAGQIVTNGGHTYTCYVGNTNQAPPNYTFWIKTEAGVIDTCIPVNEPINNSGYPVSNKFQHFAGWSATTLCANAILWCYAADATIRKFGLNAGHGETNGDSGNRANALALTTGVVSALSGTVPASQIDYGYEGHVDCGGMQSSGGTFDTANFLNWIIAIQATGASFSISEFDVTDHMAGTIAQRQTFVGLAYTNMFSALNLLAIKPDRFVCWQLRSPESWLQSFVPRGDGLTMYPNPYADESGTSAPAWAAVIGYFTNANGLQASLTINDALPHQVPASLTDQWGVAMSLSNAAWSSTNPTHIPVSGAGVVTANLGSQAATVTGSIPGTSLTQSIAITTPAATATALMLSPGSGSISAPLVETASIVDQFNNAVSAGAGPVIAFEVGGKGLSANIPAVASISTEIWEKGRIRVDDLRNLPLSSGGGLLGIDSDGAGANKKMEVYIQTGSTAFVQLAMAGYKTGNVRIGVAVTPFVALTAFPANGNYVEWFAGWDATNGKAYLQIVDANGNQINDGAHTCNLNGGVVTAIALNTDGGANGRVTVNQGFNGSAGAQAMTDDGVAIYAQTPPAIGAANTWSKPAAGDTGIAAGWLMGDSASGSVTSAAPLVGGQALVCTSATGGTGDANDWTAGSAGTVNWASDNTAVATVSPASGTSTTVTPVASGTANITAASQSTSSVSGTAAITVQAAPAPAVVAVTPPTATITSGQTVQYQATVTDQYGNPFLGATIAWTSSNTAVATIGGTTGIATFVAAGSDGITATVTSVTPHISGTAALTCTASGTTNEPSGMTVILNTGLLTAAPANGQTFGSSVFSMLSPVGGNLNGANGNVVGDANNLTAVPSGSGTGLRVTYPPALSGGNAPVRFLFSLPGAGKTLYVRFLIRYASNWTNNGNVATKIFEPQFASSNNSGNENHCFESFCDNPPTTDCFFNVQLQFPHGTESFRDIPAPGNATWAQTEPTGQLAGGSRGSWHKVECVFTPQSSVTGTAVTADGGCKTWVDGNAVANAADVIWVGPGDSQFWATLLCDATFGGGSNNPPSSNPFIFWDFDQLYVSSK